jgi:hypothetical protein
MGAAIPRRPAPRPGWRSAPSVSRQPGSWVASRSLPQKRGPAKRAGPSLVAIGAAVRRERADLHTLKMTLGFRVSLVERSPQSRGKLAIFLSLLQVRFAEVSRMLGGSTLRSFRAIDIAAASFFEGGQILHVLCTAEPVAIPKGRLRVKRKPGRGQCPGGAEAGLSRGGFLGCEFH